jgi:hypothetical protein
MADTPTKAPPASPKYVARGAAQKFDSKYGVNNYSYPEDLFSNDGKYGGNYAIFYINIASGSKLIPPGGGETVNDLTPRDRGDLVGMGLTAAQLTGAAAGTGAVEGAIAGGLLTGDLKGAGKGAVTGGVTGAAVGALVGFQGTREQKRLKTAIALHIPNNLSINYSVIYNDEDTAFFAMGAAAVQQGWELTKALGGQNNNADVTGTVGGILTNIALSKAPGSIGSGISAASGLAANPKKEQVFKGVNFRTFSFEYKFFPRNSSEAQKVLNIIEQFKYHMHPEFKDGNNFVYIYPSEFDIFYYSNGQENTKVHRHTSCVLTDMSINYAPNGMFNTFSDGMPTQIDITLQFRELALLTKEKVKDKL